jgi:hypothetical protein
MITNLPKIFKPNKLEDFSFGDVDAKRDDIIGNSFYITSIRAINPIKSGHYNLIVGERGTGKSALFRLFKEDKIKIQKENKQTYPIFIEADFDLSAFSDFVSRKVKNVTDNKIEILFKYQLVWELFLTYRLLYTIKIESGIKNSNIDQYYDSFKSSFGNNTPTNILDFLKSLKITIGAKTSSTTSDITLINTYTVIESGEQNNKKNVEIETLEMNLFEMKNIINNILIENNVIIRVFIDKLDDFVVRNDYETQKAILQSLLYVEDSFFNTNNLKMYIFLRKDIFEKLDLNLLGSDKVESRKIDLIWTKKEICDFLGRRLFYNYMKVFKLNGLEFDIDDNAFTIDDKKSPSLDDFKSETSSAIINKLKKYIPSNIKNKLRKKYNHIKSRPIDLTEELNKEIILSIFPEKVLHKTANGKEEDIEFLDYIITHTALASGNTNPRMIILFMNIIFNNLCSYYKNNPDIKINISENGRYEIIPAKIISNSYEEFKNSIKDIFRRMDKRWNDWFVKFQDVKGTRHSFKYIELYEKFGINKKKEEEFRRFLAFFVHSGLLGCPDSTKDYKLRKFIIPIVFRNTQ